MTGRPSVAAGSDDTQAAIMSATYRALCEWGYADLTIARIADEFEKSKSLLYHHHDSKDELLLEFLAHVLEEFAETTNTETEGSPRERLDALLDRLVAPAFDPDRREFIAAVVALRAQAPTDDRYREQFSRVDRRLRERVAALVREGRESGEFRADVDPERVASLVLAAVDGAMVGSVTGDEVDASAVRAELAAYLDRQVADE